MLLMMFADDLLKVFRLMRNKSKHREVPMCVLVRTVVTQLG